MLNYDRNSINGYLRQAYGELVNGNADFAANYARAAMRHAIAASADQATLASLHNVLRHIRAVELYRAAQS